jgi:hypothetical protein
MTDTQPRASKRRKLDDIPQHSDGDIRGAFELHNLLRFQQSTEPDVKAGRSKRSIDKEGTDIWQALSASENSSLTSPVRKILQNERSC